MTSPSCGTATEIAWGLAEQDNDALDITRGCLDRTRHIDAQLGAFLRLNPEAEAQAIAAKDTRRRGAAPAMCGIPIAVKDNLNTAGLETTCGSRILRGFVPLEHATAVARLRDAGVVILGKTNMDEFGMGSSTENSSFQVTRNPWAHEHVPGGSSGGSAAAVAAGMVPVALGSDTGGSVRQPAAFCGVLGLKPTYGRVSRYGLVAFGSSLDQVGILARCASDVAMVLKLIAGVDPRDATSVDAPVQDYTAATAKTEQAETARDPIQGLRIGLPNEYFSDGLDPEIDSAVRDAAARLEGAGATVEPVSLPHTSFAVPTYYLIATAEASSNLARFDAVRYGQRAAGATELRAMYRESRGAGLGAEVQRRIMLGTYALSAGYYDAYYGKAQRVRTLVRQDFTRCFNDGVDLIMTPTTPSPAFRLGEKCDDPLAMYLSDIYTVTANLAGVPALSVPVGLSSSGLPLGAQLIAADFNESTLLAAAAVLEDHFSPPLPPWSPEPAPASPR